MDQADKDLLTIKRDGLLKKKRLFDAIEKLRQISPKGSIVFETNCYDLTDAVGIHDWQPFNSLLNTISSEGAASFDIESSGGGNPWGEDIVVIKITQKFDDIYKSIRDEYHHLNKELDKEKNDVIQVEKICREGAIIKEIEHPHKEYWLMVFSKILKWFKDNKIISTIIVGVLVTLIAGFLNFIFGWI